MTVNAYAPLEELMSYFHLCFLMYFAVLSIMLCNIVCCAVGMGRTRLWLDLLIHALLGVALAGSLIFQGALFDITSNRYVYWYHALLVICTAYLAFNVVYLLVWRHKKRMYENL